ncbi:MAG: hypothetical protein WCE25_09210 [Nitrososphaeraceae archaeon]
MINNLKDLKSGKYKDNEVEDRNGKFLAEFSLLKSNTSESSL